MNYKHNLILAFIFCFVSSASFAQVQFKLKYESKQDRYIVSVIPDITYEAPKNITGTGQISIKVPTGKFDVIDIESLHPLMMWDANSRNDSPVEARGWDYISFGLITHGAPQIDYKAGEEIPLVSFRNAQGCTGKVMLVDNNTEVFMPPNSQQANIGNQLTIFGAGGNAYTKNVGTGVAKCSDYVLSDTKDILATAQVEIYPNPAKDKLNVTFDWQLDRAETTMNIMDAQGKVVMAKQFSLVKGFNEMDLNVSLLPQGAYMVEIRGGDFNIPLERFVKMD